MNTPKIHSSAKIAKGAVIEGDVTIGENCSVYYNAVIRGDASSITIGSGTNVQDCCVIHCDTNAPATIGNNVTIGHGAIVHGCTIGDSCLIGMGSIILNNAKIGKNCLIAAGALVTQNTVIPDGSLVMGMPAKVKRALTQEEIEHIKSSADIYLTLSKSMQF